jgi:hypothetical protein
MKVRNEKGVNLKTTIDSRLKAGLQTKRHQARPFVQPGAKTVAQ